MGPGSIWQMIYAIRDCELKNDALMLNLYELIAEKYPKGRPYAIYMYYGAYDVPIKGSDKAYPAFTNRSTDINHVNFYSQDYEEAMELMKFLNLE